MAAAKRKPKTKAQAGSLSESLVRDLRKDFGRALDVLVEGVPDPNRSSRVATGAMNLDWVLSGGLPRGRVTELYSQKPSQGKTAVAYSILRSAQEAGDVAVLFDAEKDLKYDGAWERLVALGIDTKALIVGYPDSIEHTFEMADALIQGARRRSSKLVIVWDSLAATPPASQVEADDYENQQPAAQARAVSKCLKTFLDVLADADATLLVVNQSRQDIGSRFGPRYDSVAGAAVKFAAACRLEMWRRRDGMIEGPGKTSLGIIVTIKAVKCKVGQPFRTADLDILFDTGLDRFASCLRTAVQMGVVVADGPVYRLIGEKGEKSSFHKSNFDRFLEDNPKVEAAIIKAYEASVAPKRKK